MIPYDHFLSMFPCSSLSIQPGRPQVNKHDNTCHIHVPWPSQSSYLNPKYYLWGNVYMWKNAAASLLQIQTDTLYATGWWHAMAQNLIKLIGISTFLVTIHTYIHRCIQFPEKIICVYLYYMSYIKADKTSTIPCGFYTKGSDKSVTHTDEVSFLPRRSLPPLYR